MIESTQNPKIKLIQKLKKARNRKKYDLILVEGETEIKSAIEADFKICSLFMTPAFRVNNSFELSDDAEIMTVSEPVFDQIAYRDNPQGCLALVKPRYLELNDIKLSNKPLVIIVEAIEKPGNLGAILRTADAAAVDAVIVADPHTDVFNLNVIRASLGTVFSMPLVLAENSKIKRWLEESRISGVAAVVGAKKEYTKVDYNKATAIIVGTEHEGLSKFWQTHANTKASIPMLGKADSLNASVSTAILVFEAIRQRHCN